MKPSRELDALIAEKVMGCKVLWQSATVHGPYCGCNYGQPGASLEAGPHGDERYMDANLKEYSTDIAAAWEVVEKLKLSIVWEPGTSYSQGMWEVYTQQDVREYRLEYGSDIKSESAPHAICLAALKAVEAK